MTTISIPLLSTYTIKCKCGCELKVTVSDYRNAEILKCAKCKTVFNIEILTP